MSVSVQDILDECDRLIAALEKAESERLKVLEWARSDSDEWPDIEARGDASDSD